MAKISDQALEAQIRGARKLSLDGAKAIYDLTTSVDFSKPRRTAEAIARVVWDLDVQDWWTWREGQPICSPTRKVELRLPREHDRRVAKAAEEFRADLKTEEFAPQFDSYAARLADNRADWVSIFILGPLWAWLLQAWGNRQVQRAEIDRLFEEMEGYIVVSPV